MKIKSVSLLAPVLSALFIMACGQQNDQDSDLDGFKKKKHYVLACDGVVFDNNDAFGRRVTFAREGSKQFKQTSDFVLANETTEWRNVVANLAGDCISGANRIQGFVANICGQINAADPQLRFNTMETVYGNVTYKGSWSCNLKEKSK